MKYDPEYYRNNKDIYKRASKRWADATRVECPLCKVLVRRVQWVNGTHVESRVHQTNHEWFTGKRGPLPSPEEVESVLAEIDFHMTRRVKQKRAQ